MTSEPLQHIERALPPFVPDTGARTECGHLVKDVAACITLPQARALTKKYGQQRAAFLLCMTCANLVQYRADTWEKNPVDVTVRWLERARYRQQQQQTGPSETDILYALTTLAANHPEEYLALVNGDGTVSLTQHRANRRHP